MTPATVCPAEEHEAFEFLQPSHEPGDDPAGDRFLIRQSLLHRSQTKNSYMKSASFFTSGLLPPQRQFVSPFARPGSCDVLKRQQDVENHQLSAKTSPSVSGGGEVSLPTKLAAEGPSTPWRDTVSATSGVQEKAVTPLRSDCHPIAAQYAAHPGSDRSGDQMARNLYSGSTASSASAGGGRQAAPSETRPSFAERHIDSAWRVNSVRSLSERGGGGGTAAESPNQQLRGQPQQQLQPMLFPSNSGEQLSESYERFGQGVARARGGERHLRSATTAGIRLSTTSVSPAASNYGDSRISHDPVAGVLHQQGDYVGDARRRFPVRGSAAAAAAPPRQTEEANTRIFTSGAQQSYLHHGSGRNSSGVHGSHNSGSGVLLRDKDTAAESACGSGSAFCSSSTPFLSARGPRAAAERAYFDAARETHASGGGHDADEIPQLQRQALSGASTATAAVVGHASFLEGGNSRRPALAAELAGMQQQKQKQQQQHLFLGGSGGSLHSSAAARGNEPENTVLPQIGGSSNFSCSGEVHSSRGSRTHHSDRSRGTRHQHPRTGRRSRHHRKGKIGSSSGAAEGPLISDLSNGIAHSAGREEALHAASQRGRGREACCSSSSGGSNDSSSSSSSISGNMLQLLSFQTTDRNHHPAADEDSSSFAAAGNLRSAPSVNRVHPATAAGTAAGDSLQPQLLGVYNRDAYTATAALMPAVRDGSTSGLGSYIDSATAAIGARREGEKQQAETGLSEEERSRPPPLHGQDGLQPRRDWPQLRPHLPVPTAGATAHRLLQHTQEASQQIGINAARERIELLSGSFSPAPRTQGGADDIRGGMRRDISRDGARRQRQAAAAGGSAAALHSSSSSIRDGVSQQHARVVDDSNGDWRAERRKSVVKQQQQQQEGQLLQYSGRSSNTGSRVCGSAALSRSHARIPTPAEGRLQSLPLRAVEEGGDDEEEHEQQQQQSHPAVFQQAAAAAAEPCLSPRVPSGLLSEKERVGFDRMRSTSAAGGSAAAGPTSTYAALFTSERSTSSRIRSNSSMSRLLPHTLGEQTAEAAAAVAAGAPHGECELLHKGGAPLSSAAALPLQRCQLYAVGELSPAPTAAGADGAAATAPKAAGCCDTRGLGTTAAAADTPVQKEGTSGGGADRGTGFVTATSTFDGSVVGKPTLLQEQQLQQQHLLLQQQRPPLLLTEPSVKYASRGEREEGGESIGVAAGGTACDRRAASAGASSAGSSSRSGWYSVAAGNPGGPGGPERISSAGIVCVCHASRAMARQKAQYEQQVRRLEEERQQHQQRMRLLAQEEEQQEQLQQQLQRQRDRVMQEEEQLRVHREQLSQEQQELTSRWRQLEQQQLELGERKDKWRRLAQQKKEELQVVAAKLKAEKKMIEERKRGVEKEEAALKQRAESVERGEEKLSSERIKLQEQQLAVEREKTEAAEAAAAATAERLDACRRADEVARVEERLRQEEEQQQQRAQELQRQEQQVQQQEKALQQQAAMQEQREEELTRRSKALEEQRAALEREEERLQEVAVAQQQQLQHRSSQLAAKEKEVAHARQRLETAQQELETAQEQLQNRETDVLQQQQDGEKRLRDMAEQLRKEREKQQQQMSEERAIFEREIEEEKQHMEAERQRMHDVLQQQKSRWGEEKKKQEQTLETERELIKKMRAEVEVSQKTCEAEASSVHARERSLAAQREELLELQQQLERKEQELKGREQQLQQEMREREQQLQQQGQQQEAKLDELRQLAEQELREQKREQEEQADEERERLQLQQQNLDEERQRLQQLEQQLHEQKLKLQQELSSQVSKEERLFERERRVREQEQRLQREQQRMQHQQQQTDQQLRQQQEQQREQEARTREREQQLQLREEEMREREKKVAEVQRQIDQLHEEQTALSIDRSALEAEKESVERDRQILTEKLEYWTRQLSRREDEVKRREKQARLKLRDIETEQKVLRVRMQEDIGKIRPYRTAAANSPSPFGPAAAATRSQSPPGPRLATFQPPLMLGRSNRSTAAADDEEESNPLQQQQQERRMHQHERVQKSSLTTATEGAGGGMTPTGDSAADEETSGGASAVHACRSSSSRDPPSLQKLVGGPVGEHSRGNNNSSSSGSNNSCAQQQLRTSNEPAVLANKGSSDIERLGYTASACSTASAAPPGRDETGDATLRVECSASSPRSTESKPGGLQQWSAAAVGSSAPVTASGISVVAGTSSNREKKTVSPHARQVTSATTSHARRATTEAAGGNPGSRLREGSLRSAAQQRQLLNSSTNSNASQRSTSQCSAFRRDRSRVRAAGGGGLWGEAGSKSIGRSPPTAAAGVDSRMQRRQVGLTMNRTRACTSSIISGGSGNSRSNTSSSSGNDRSHHAVEEDTGGRAVGQLRDEEIFSKKDKIGAAEADHVQGGHAAAATTAARMERNSTYYYDSAARQQQQQEQRVAAEEGRKQRLSGGPTAAPVEHAAAVSYEAETAVDCANTREPEEGGQDKSYVLSQQRPRLSRGEAGGPQGGWGSNEATASSTAAQRDSTSLLRRPSSAAAVAAPAAAAALAGEERNLSLLQGGRGGEELQAPPADPSALSPVSRRLPAAGGLSAAASTSRSHSASIFPSSSSSFSTSSCEGPLTLPPLGQQLRDQRAGRRSADPGAGTANTASLQLHCTPYLDAEDDPAAAASSVKRAAGNSFLPCISSSSSNNSASTATAAATNGITRPPQHQQQEQHTRRWIPGSAASAAPSPVERRQSSYKNPGDVELSNNPTKSSSSDSLDGLRGTPRPTEIPDSSSSSSSNNATSGGGTVFDSSSSRRSLSILRPRSAAAAAAPLLEKINDDTLLPASPPVRPHLEASATAAGPSKKEREAPGCPRSSSPPALNTNTTSSASCSSASSSSASNLLSRISSFLRRGGGRSSAAADAEASASAEYHTPRGGRRTALAAGGEAPTYAGGGVSPGGGVAAAGDGVAAASEESLEEAVDTTCEGGGMSSRKQASGATSKITGGTQQQQLLLHQGVRGSLTAGAGVSRQDCEDSRQASFFGFIRVGEGQCAESLSTAQPRRNALNENSRTVQQQQQQQQRHLQEKDHNRHFSVEPSTVGSTSDALLPKREGKSDCQGELLQHEDSTRSSSVAAASPHVALATTVENGASSGSLRDVLTSQEATEFSVRPLHTVAAGRGAAGRKVAKSVIPMSPQQAAKTPLCGLSTDAAPRKVQSPAGSAAPATDADIAKSGSTFVARESVISHLSAFNNEESDYGDVLLTGGTLRGCS